MEGTYNVTPHVIERWQIADAPEYVSVPDREHGGRGLLVFTNEEEAEAFRTATGKYPPGEGFEVVYVDHEGLRNLIRMMGVRSVAVVGLEPGGGAGGFDAEGFCDLLEEVA